MNRILGLSFLIAMSYFGFLIALVVVGLGIGWTFELLLIVVPGLIALVLVSAAIAVVVGDARKGKRGIER